MVMASDIDVHVGKRLGQAQAALGAHSVAPQRSHRHPLPTDPEIRMRREQNVRRAALPSGGRTA